ncbi:MAG: isoprenyl transferase [Candidatus Omnitrophica bacterium]|nr:isoprenyl transferase [Candidatus Omnitrophota bacterium]MBU4302964.1 isoprenyl transferase [Candidatus Omnitrophota bacterium]MBU4467400.1 isoprenyl transferase [Candidatus Omnitrophota bacterium]MCG2708494.1 isoprenyl transferase [Candidatus Omnitrophota bacterium]
MQDNFKIPKHIAFIMDGNGRWAKERGLPRTAGHRQGAQRVKEIIRGAGSLGIRIVTFFAFSTENWSRPKSEVNFLMRYLDNFLGQEIKVLHKNNMRFTVIGRDDPLPKYLQARINKAQGKTRENTGLRVVLALNYGGRQEIVDAAKKFTRDVLEERVDLESLDAEEFSRYLYTADIPDPDLLIRTSNEMRISNFLLWQLSYSEFYFSGKCWPDFGIEQLKEAIKEYQKRDRRFGGIDVN